MGGGAFFRSNPGTSLATLDIRITSVENALAIRPGPVVQGLLAGVRKKSSPPAVVAWARRRL